MELRPIFAIEFCLFDDDPPFLGFRDISVQRGFYFLLLATKSCCSMLFIGPNQRPTLTIKKTKSVINSDFIIAPTSHKSRLNARTSIEIANFNYFALLFGPLPLLRSATLTSSTSFKMRVLLFKYHRSANDELTQEDASLRFEREAEEEKRKSEYFSGKHNTTERIATAMVHSKLKTN